MEKTSKANLIKRFLPYYRPYTRILITDLLLSVMSTCCAVVLPMIVSTITDMATEDLSLLTPAIICRCAVVYLALRVIDTAARYYMVKVGHMMGAHIEADMRYEMFSHLQDMSFGYYSSTKTGQLMSRLSKDLFDVTEFCHHCPEEFLVALIKFIVSFFVLLNVNVPLTLILFLSVPFLGYFVVKMQGELETQFHNERNEIGEINASIEDTLLGIRVVQSFANEDMERKKFREENGVFLKIKETAYTTLAKVALVARGFEGVMYITIVTIGAVFLMNGKITTGQYVEYLLYTTVLLESVARLADFSDVFMSGLTGIERFFEVMDQPAEIVDAPDAEAVTDVSGKIDIENVSFSYDESKSDVLTNLTIHVNPGDNIALVGPSGGGKTTLSNLIPRFYDVTSGKILLDGKDIRKITLKSLRDNIGVVQQDVYLFGGTVYENILYGKPSASKDEVIEAAKLAGADEFIDELENGYDTYVGERGVKLSGGQKQRISIARVFLKNPPVLILDEATSALDNESERMVQKSLEKLSEGRTVFTIAHRLSTIKNAKTILVLNDSGIVESGSHDELMKKKGLYYDLQMLAQN